MAVIKNNPIKNHTNLSKAIAGEKAWPEFIISERGSKGSNLNLNLLNLHSIQKNF